MERPRGPGDVAAARRPDWAREKARELTALPGPHRYAIQKMLDEEPPLLLDDDTFLDAVTLFFSLRTRAGRSSFFQTLFPGLSPHFEEAWRTADRRPYQRGHSRLPFRAPGRADLADSLRSRWFLASVDALRGLDVDLEWLTRHAPHLPLAWRDVQWAGWLLGTALRSETGADPLRGVAREVLLGGAEAGTLGRELIAGLLNSPNPDDWELVGKTLLAAKRQEGLRQSILESVDEANPEAFRYILDLVLEHGLDRFSATVRAADVWLGMEWGAGGGVRDLLQALAAVIDDSEAVDAALEGGSGEEVYLALWSVAYRDAPRAVERALPILDDPDVERRFAALLLVTRSRLFPESFEAVAGRLRSGREDDPRVQMAMVHFLAGLTQTSADDALFDAVATVFEQAPAKKKKLDPILWPWLTYDHDRRLIGKTLHTLVKGSADRMIPFAASLESYDCAAVIHDVAGTGFFWRHGQRIARARRTLTPDARKLLIELLGDTRRTVHEAAFEAMESHPVREDEVERLVGILHRKAPSLRMGAIARLLKLPDREVLAVAERLLDDAHEKRRAAGAELLSTMVERGRAVARAKAMAARSGSDDEGVAVQDALDAALTSESGKGKDDPFLGLLPSASPPDLVRPGYKGSRIESTAVERLLSSLGERFTDHADQEVEVASGAARHRVLLGEASGRLPLPPPGAGAEEARALLPLADVWLDWLDEGGGRGGDDGHDVVRAWAWMSRGNSAWEVLPDAFRVNRNWSLVHGLDRVLAWMVALEPGPDPAGFLVDYAADAVAKARPSGAERKETRRYGFHRGGWKEARFRIAEGFQSAFPWLTPPEARHRLAVAELLALRDGLRGLERGPTLARFAAAYDAGAVRADDLIWFLLMPRTVDYGMGPRVDLGPIRDATRLRTPTSLADRPELADAARRVRDRIVEVEVGRGELPGPASGPASEVLHAGGAEQLMALARALGKDKLVRQHQWGVTSRPGSLSRLIAVTSPAADDTAERFAELWEKSGVTARRLIEIAMYAPQWAEHAEAALDRPGLAETAWWVHAHTKQNAYWRERDFRESWNAAVSERTELVAEDLEEGAVDVRWFASMVELIGEDGWVELSKAARYASNSGGHKRAQLFADSMLGRVDEGELMARVDDKRHQDSVRALGLLPLPTEPEARARVTLDRYERLHRFIKESRKFGSQRQASERRAVEIGLQNLARTAGYRDPHRLTWAMEREALADLADGPVTVEADDVRLTLSIDEDGAPKLDVIKGERRLKNVPARLRKEETVVALRSRMKELRGQRSRMRASLETSMIRGYPLEGRELVGFAEHPMLAPLVDRIVFVGEDASTMGYPDQGGRALRDASGALHAVGESETLRIAHPTDFQARGDWSEWLRECFRVERVQPFKQLFRELYLRTEAEQDDTISRRYAGHQVGPSQALALLKGRGWVVSPDEGVKKTFHDEKLVALLWFQEHFYTPAEVDGLTLEGVSFGPRGRLADPIALSEVPTRLFSEVMRDLDLVVSVAHQGGVDPEASSSTVEMRARLVTETARLLQLDNVELDGHHAKIVGERGRYAVHLGSANASVHPGRALVIVAVHSQYRGRLFLPFADEDPRTSEVLAKVLLLARDGEIKDPSILRQIVT